MHSALTLEILEKISEETFKQHAKGDKRIEKMASYVFGQIQEFLHEEICEHINDFLDEEQGEL